jgi:hypothetical protein
MSFWKTPHRASSTPDTRCMNCNMEFTSRSFKQHVEKGTTLCQYSHAESLKYSFDYGDEESSQKPSAASPTAIICLRMIPTTIPFLRTIIALVIPTTRMMMLVPIPPLFRILLLISMMMVDYLMVKKMNFQCLKQNLFPPVLMTMICTLIPMLLVRDQR